MKKCLTAAFGLPRRYLKLRRKLRDEPLGGWAFELAVASLRCGCDVDDPDQLSDLIVAFVLAKDCRREYRDRRLEKLFKGQGNESIQDGN